MLLVVVGALGISWWTYSSLDDLVKEAIERHGSEAAGSPVLVDSVHIKLSLDQGQGIIEGLALRNPEGFPAGDAIRFGRIEIEIDPSSVTSNPVIIQSVRLLAPEINFIMNAEQRSNFDAIRENLRQRSQASQADESSAAEPVRILIREFVLGEGKVKAQIASLGGRPIEVELARAEERDLGAPDGSLPGELARDLVNRVSRRVLAAMAQRGLERLLEDQLGEEVGKKVKDLLDSVLSPKRKP